MKIGTTLAKLSATAIGLLTSVSSSFAAQVCYSVRQAGDSGFQAEVCDGKQAGVTYQSRAIEQIKIRTLEAGAHVCYKVHIAGYGWNNNNGTSLPYCNNQVAGVVGRRVEGIEILDDRLPYTQSIFYRTHVQNKAWIATVWDGQLGGTTGQSLRMEAIQISIGSRPRCPNQNYSFQGRTPPDGLATYSLAFNPSSLPTTQQPVCAMAQLGIYDPYFAQWQYPDSQINSPWGGSQYVSYWQPEGSPNLYVKPDRYDNVADAYVKLAGGRTKQETRATRDWTTSPNGTGITMMDMVGR